ncbi:MAG: rcc01693 family protein [Pseudomonadota bacterium]
MSDQARAAIGVVDWAALMRLGLGQLRLAPDVFWAMTPIEFQRALEGAGLTAAEAAPGRGMLDALIARFPDAPAAPLETGSRDLEVL